MNAIIGFTSLAQEHIDERGQVADYLKKISASSRHLLSIINDILDMSRIESGEVRLEPKPVHLPELVENVRNIIQVGAAAKNISFTVDTSGMKNEDVTADPLRLDQILINILSNSVKFTPDGGTIALWILQKDTAPDGFADYEFHVRDSGIGMSKEFQKHIFEQFARERTSTVSKTQGTGLGMAITKKFVDMMGGAITLESEQGKGTEFTVSLRFAVVKESAERKAPAAQPSDFSGKKLLVVEDNELNLEISATILREAGFEAARRIRALPNKRKAAIPIVATATPANAFEEVREKAVNAGITAAVCPSRPSTPRCSVASIRAKSLPTAAAKAPVAEWSLTQRPPRRLVRP